MSKEKHRDEDKRLEKQLNKIMQQVSSRFSPLPYTVFNNQCPVCGDTISSLDYIVGGTLDCAELNDKYCFLALPDLQILIIEHKEDENDEDSDEAEGVKIEVE